MENDEVKRQASVEDFGDYVLSKARVALGVKVKAAKGAKPTVYYQCLPDHDPPDLSEQTATGEQLPLPVV